MVGYKVKLNRGAYALVAAAYTVDVDLTQPPRHEVMEAVMVVSV